MEAAVRPSKTFFVDLYIGGPLFNVDVGVHVCVHCQFSTLIRDQNVHQQRPHAEREALALRRALP